MNCPYCNLLSNSTEDDTYICKMTSGTLFLNFNQSFKGRCIFMLNHHEEDIAALDSNIFINFNLDLLKIIRAIKSVFEPTLINVGMFGNKIRHLHWHIIPRYEGDSNWGGVPWPNKPLKLSKKEYRDRAIMINRALQEAQDGRES